MKTSSLKNPSLKNPSTKAVQDSETVSKVNFSCGARHHKTKNSRIQQPSLFFITPKAPEDSLTCSSFCLQATTTFSLCLKGRHADVLIPTSGHAHSPAKAAAFHAVQRLKTNAHNVACARTHLFFGLTVRVYRPLPSRSRCASGSAHRRV